jgi:peptide/nickel transport system permease protein
MTRTLGSPATPDVPDVLDMSLSVPASARSYAGSTSPPRRTPWSLVARAVGIASIAAFARVMRAETIRVAHTDYVEAAHGLGVGRWGVVLSHVLPNSLSPVLALAALEFGTAVIAVASLGFLGYGAPPPEPEWGLLVAEGRDFIALYPWISVLPGVVLALVVIATHRISTSLRSSH